MKLEKISLDLLHEVDKDYECKNSHLIIEVQWNNKKYKKNINGIEAESLFSLVKDIIDKEDEKNGTSN